MCGRRTNGRKAIERWLRANLEFPGVTPEKDLFLAIRDGRVIGYTWTQLELKIDRAIAWIRTSGEEQGTDALINRLIEVGCQRAIQAGTSIFHVPVEYPYCGVRIPVLEAAGFKFVRSHMHMQRPNAHIGVPTIPEQLRLRPFDKPGDTALLTELQNSVFEGSWGYSPNTEAEVFARLKLPGQGTDGVLFLEAPEGPAGYCWTAFEKEPGRSTGKILMMGLRTEYRGEGLGHLIAARAIQHLQNQGVQTVTLEADTRNDAAVALYRRLGFEKTSEVRWYELRPTG